MLVSYISIFLATACVDRFYHDIDKTANRGISITGHISDQSGPYEVRVYSVFDIESKESQRVPVSVKQLTLSDSEGKVEILSEIDKGIYRTSPLGIKGVVGGVYKLTVELLDGGLYESMPDTILAPSPMDSMYLQFNQSYNSVGKKEYTFDVFFDATIRQGVNNRLMWKFTGTFQAETHPESPAGGCIFLAEISQCNFVPACSGYRNVGTNARPVLEQKFPCTCCTCWYNLHNDYPILSDDQFSMSGKLEGVKIYSVPLNEWTLWHRIRVEVAQRSLTNNSFKFFKAIRDQKDAIGNLFQPISGRIPNAFVQLSGPKSSIEGIFFATSISKKVKYVQRFGSLPNIGVPPNFSTAISSDEPFAINDCRLKFPNSTNIKPAFWED